MKRDWFSGALNCAMRAWNCLYCSSVIALLFTGVLMKPPIFRLFLKARAAVSLAMT